MILNPGKRYYMVLGDHTQIRYTILNAFEIEKSRNEALLGAILDNDLDSHIKSLCMKLFRNLGLFRLNLNN